MSGSSQQSSSPSCSGTKSESSEPELYEHTSDWNKNWEGVLSRFHLRRINCIDGCLITMEKCLSLMPALDLISDVPEHIMEIIHVFDRNFTIDVTDECLVRLKDESTREYRRKFKQDMTCCEENINAELNMHLKQRIMKFVNRFKYYLSHVRYSSDNEMSVQCLFQDFADMVGLEFKCGNDRKTRKRHFETRKGAHAVLVKSKPGLRAVLHTENWENPEREKVLCLAEVKRRHVCQLTGYDGYGLRTRPGDDTNFSLRMSERLVGQILGEMLVDYNWSAFYADSQVIAFGVLGTQVQMFLLEMNGEHFNVEASEPRSSSSKLYISTPYDIFLKEDRLRLLHIMAKLGSYRLT